LALYQLVTLDLLLQMNGGKHTRIIELFEMSGIWVFHH